MKRQYGIYTQLRFIATGGSKRLSLRWCLTLRYPLRSLRTRILSALVLSIAPTYQLYASDTDHNTLTKTEAAYLYKFTKFIQWPDDRFTQSKILNLCLIGNQLEALERHLLESTQGKRSNGFQLNIQRSADMSKITDHQHCHLVYLNTPPQHLAQTFNINNTLIINSPAYDLDDNSLLSLDITNGKLGFSINQSLLGSTKLEINAALLSLARKTQ